MEVGSGIFQSEILRLDRVDIISGPTDRNSAYVSSALRLLAEKDIGDGTIRLEQNITDTTDVFVSWEQKQHNACILGCIGRVNNRVEVSMEVGQLERSSKYSGEWISCIVVCRRGCRMV